MITINRRKNLKKFLLYAKIKIILWFITQTALNVFFVLKLLPALFLDKNFFLVQKKKN